MYRYSELLLLHAVYVEFYFILIRKLLPVGAKGLSILLLIRTRLSYRLTQAILIIILCFGGLNYKNLDVHTQLTPQI